LNVTLPLPLPLDPAVMEIQASLAAAVHAQSLDVVTLLDEFVLPDAPIEKVVGLTAYEQGVAAAPWLTVTVCPATVKVPVRAAPLFVAMLNATVPSPLPLDDPEIEIQDASLLADQPQPAPADTETERDAAAASTSTPSGVTENVHVGSGGGTVGGVVGGTIGGVVGGTIGAELESWVIRTLRPAIVTVAERSLPTFAATVSVTVPGPVPVDPDVTVTHDASDRAVQAQPASVSTVILVVPPAAATFWPFGEMLNWHAAASCRICARTPLTTTSPWRELGAGLAATVTCTCPAPCPEAGVSPVSQLVSVEAFQVHSGWVLTAIVAAEPAAPIAEGGAVSVTLHFAGDGPVDVATVEPQPVDTQAMHQMSSGTRVGVRHRREDILQVSPVFQRGSRDASISRREKRTNSAADEQRTYPCGSPCISAVCLSIDCRDSDRRELLSE
jgi:hypothetical protein